MPEQPSTGVYSAPPANGLLSVSRGGKTYTLTPLGGKVILAETVGLLVAPRATLAINYAIAKVVLPFTVAELVDFEIFKRVAETVSGGSFSSITEKALSPFVVITRNQPSETARGNLIPAARGVRDTSARSSSRGANTAQKSSLGADP